MSLPESQGAQTAQPASRHGEQLAPPEETAWPSVREEWLRSRDRLVAQGSVADGVYRLLRMAIVEGRLPAGLRLREQPVADVLGVSRTPVREALLRLTAGRLVGRDAHGTSQVQGLTPKRIRDVYAVRRVLEGLAARLAAQVSDDALVAELTHINDALGRATEAGDTARARELNIAFHEALARGANNEELLDLIHETYGWVRRMPSTTLSYPGRAEAAAAEHGLIIEMIKGRRADEAERVAQQHLMGSLAIRMSMLFDSGDP